MDENKDVHISEDSFVTLTKMNHIVEIQYLEKRNTSCLLYTSDAADE